MMERIFHDILLRTNSYAQEQLEFVIALSNENSYTYNKKGVDKVGNIITDKLRTILPVHDILKQEKIGDHHIFKTVNPSNAIYLVGHMDTVFTADHPFQKCQVNGDILNGPGSGDMKGGLAVMIYALKILQDLNVLNQLRIVLICNSDEEVGSPESQSLFMNECENAMACIGAECAGINNEIVTSRNGKLGARIDCYGQDRHVSVGTHVKSSAILELAHKIIEIESLNSALPGVSVNVGKIEGGMGPSTIADHAFCLLDIRWVEDDHKDFLLQKIQALVSRSNQEGCCSEFKILNSRPAMPVGIESDNMFQFLQKVGNDLGQNIAKEHRRGTSDVNFFGAAGIPTLDGLGPVCEYDHTAREYIKISSLKERTALLVSFLIKYGEKIGMMSNHYS